jgi:hypothetical protein
MSMTVERFQQVLSAKPFRPFTIHLADGDSIHVVSREFVAPSPSGRTIVVFQPDDRMNILDLLLVTNLEVEPANGDRPRRKK